MGLNFGIPATEHSRSLKSGTIAISLAALLLASCASQQGEQIVVTEDFVHECLSRTQRGKTQRRKRDSA